MKLTQSQITAAQWVLETAGRGDLVHLNANAQQELILRARGVMEQAMAEGFKEELPPRPQPHPSLMPTMEQLHQSAASNFPAVAPLAIVNKDGKTVLTTDKPASPEQAALLFVAATQHQIVPASEAKPVENAADVDLSKP